MKRLLLTFACITVGTSIALAAAHFLSASARLDGADLVVDFREAGLGNNQTIHYIGSASVDVLYACINGGNKNPKAGNKRNISGDVSAEGDFTSGKNGSLRGQLRIEPPDPGDFSCPSGQRMVLAEVLYENIQVTDTTNNVSIDIPGTYSSVFVDLD